MRLHCRVDYTGCEHPTKERVGETLKVGAIIQGNNARAWIYNNMQIINGKYIIRTLNLSTSDHCELVSQRLGIIEDTL